MVPLALPACGLPLTSAPPLRTWTVNAGGVAVPPLLFVTVVMTVSVGATSLAVIVQDFGWPTASGRNSPPPPHAEAETRS